MIAYVRSRRPRDENGFEMHINEKKARAKRRKNIVAVVVLAL